MSKIQQIPPWYKISPLGLIPSDWEIKRFGDIFDFKNGLNASKEDYGDGVRFINVMEVIYNYSIDSSQIPGRVKTTEQQREAYWVSKWDVLFNRTSETTEEIGLSSVYLGDEPVVFWGFVIRWKPKGDILDNQFKKYCFRSEFIRNQIIKNGQWAIRSNIGQDNLEKVLLPVPATCEQVAIANLLSVWDDAILKTSALIRQHEQRRWQLSCELLNGKRRLSGFIEPWNKVKFKEIWFFPKKEAIKSINDEKLLTVKLHTKWVEFNSKDNPIISGTWRPYYKRYTGEILIGRQNIHNGWVWLVTTEFDWNICSNAISSFQVNQKHSWSFILEVLQNPSFYKKVENYMWWTGQKELWEKQFLEIDLRVPSFSEETAIAKVLEVNRTEIQLLKSKLEKLKEQKNGLMQQLLTGKKRLQF